MRQIIFSTLLIMFFNYGFSQSIKDEATVLGIQSGIDNDTSFKSFTIRPNLFTNKGESWAGRHIYHFTYDSIKNILQKIEIIDTEKKQSQRYYFLHDRLLLVTTEKKYEYFFDKDFDIPYSPDIDKNNLQRDKYKETAYRLLMRFRKQLKTDVNN